MKIQILKKKKKFDLFENNLKFTILKYSLKKFKNYYLKSFKDVKTFFTLYGSIFH